MVFYLKRAFLILVGIVAVSCLLFGVTGKYRDMHPKVNTPPDETASTFSSTSYITIDNQKILVEIADTNQERSRGLSGRTSLEENSGMLFVFDQKITPSFWMKDMLIPIDIIWIADKQIIGIEKNVANPLANTPTSELPTYTPRQPVDHVLEVAAGFSDTHGIRAGSRVDMSGL